MLKLSEGAALVAATIAMGIITGVFHLYAYAIMPVSARPTTGLLGASSRSTGRSSTPCSWPPSSARWCYGLATLLVLGGDGRSVLPWVVAALVLYALVVVLTLAVNVPLNDQLKAAGDPDRIADLAAVRERFNEARWVGWNLVRAIASTVAFGCLSWALVLYGRTVTPGGP